MKKIASLFPTHKLPKPIQKNLDSFIIGGILILLLLGTFVAVQLSQRQQELRQRASVDQGNVVVTGRVNPDPLLPGQSGELIFSANTNSANVLGVQLEFTVTNLASAPTLEGISASGMNILGSNITDNGGGSFSVSFASATPPAQTPISFNSSTPVDFAKITFIPAVSGTPVSLTFNNTNSTSLLSDTFADTLQPVQPMSFAVASVDPTATPIAEATATFTPTPTQCAQPTPPLCQVTEHVECVDTSGSAVCQTCVCTPNTTDPTATPVADNPTATPIVQDPTPTLIAQVDPTATPFITNVPAPTATPDTSGTGGITVKQCGGTCSAHTECAVNLMCYSGVCRLANNPTDTSCNNPPDMGIHRTCNEYCADSRECNSGLTCYYNRCRNPRNVSDQYCSEPVAVAPQTRTQTRIVTQNHTVTVIVTATPEPFTSTDVPQGGDNTIAQILPTEAPFVTNTPWPTYAPIAEMSPEPAVDEFTMVDRIQTWLKGLLIVALAISAVFFLLWILPLFFKRRDDDDDVPPTPVHQTGTNA